MILHSVAFRESTSDMDKRFDGFTISHAQEQYLIVKRHSTVGIVALACKTFDTTSQMPLTRISLTVYDAALAYGAYEIDGSA